jgi:hypothetical protein
MKLIDIIQVKQDEYKGAIWNMNYLSNKRKAIAYKFDKEYSAILKRLQINPGSTSWELRRAVNESTKIQKYKIEIAKNSVDRANNFKQIKRIKTELKNLKDANSKIN